jgi:chromate transporter
MKELVSLFFTFMKIGAFTFGGGYAMLPMIQREVVNKKGYATEEEVLDYYAIGQLTPGVIAVNVATFIGYKRRGIAGAISATAGVIFPSLVIITIIAAVIQNFADIYYVKCALAGIRVAVLALIVKTIIKMAKNGVKGYLTASIMILAFALMMLGLPAVAVVIIAAITGVLSKKAVKSK